MYQIRNEMSVPPSYTSKLSREYMDWSRSTAALKLEVPIWHLKFPPRSQSYTRHALKCKGWLKLTNR